MALRSNLLTRVLTAVVLGPLIAALILWKNPHGFAGLVLLAIAIGQLEFYGMTLPAEERGARLLGALFGVGLAATIYLAPTSGLPLVCLAAATLGLFLYHLVRVGEMTSVGVRLAQGLAGILYVALLLAPLTILKRRPDGAAWIFLILTITWFSDTGAYFAGRFLGKHKLYPQVSPAKTVEGAVGGLLSSVGAAALAKLWYLPALSWLDCLLLAIPAGALGQAGDLCESLLKRASGVKDSGNILPGHGGLLDRIDAVLFATPYVYVYAVYLQPLLSAQAAAAAAAR